MRPTPLTELSAILPPGPPLPLPEPDGVPLGNTPGPPICRQTGKQNTAGRAMVTSHCQGQLLAHQLAETDRYLVSDGSG